MFRATLFASLFALPAFAQDSCGPREDIIAAVSGPDGSRLFRP